MDDDDGQATDHQDVCYTDDVNELQRRTLVTTMAHQHPSDGLRQIGPQYSSNSAGDGPEKTRDRKYWFPRFKSNWLGSYRSKQMFTCCECAVQALAAEGDPTATTRYKGADGTHCSCGRDEWHLAKTIEENEYNRRMDISKAVGGMRYDDAVDKLREAGMSEANAVARYKAMDQNPDMKHLALNDRHPGSVKSDLIPRRDVASQYNTLPPPPEDVSFGTGEKAEYGYASPMPIPYQYTYPSLPIGPGMYDQPNAAMDENFQDILQNILEDPPQRQQMQSQTYPLVHKSMEERMKVEGRMHLPPPPQYMDHGISCMSQDGRTMSYGPTPVNSNPSDASYRMQGLEPRRYLDESGSELHPWHGHPTSREI